MDSETYRWGWYAIEFVVVLFEAVVLAGVMRLPGLRALMLSTVANGFSAIVGRFL